MNAGRDDDYLRHMETHRDTWRLVEIYRDSLRYLETR